MSKRKKDKASSTSGNEQMADSAVFNPLRFWLSVAFLAIAIGASLMMVLDHFGGMALPGCGEGSGCDRAARSVWGTVPGINVPTSATGLAFFLALAVAWVRGRGEAAPGFAWIVRIGAVISIGLLAIIAIEKHFCIYCLAAHGGNLAFWVMLETGALSTRDDRRSLPALATVAVTFAAALIVFALFESRHRETLREQSEVELAESTQRIIDQTAAGAAASADPMKLVHTPEGGFTGRWLQGPENAPIRMVIFMGYQCKDCAQIEDQVQDILRTRSDVSLSVKHFPLNSSCNRYMNRTMHPNACWAARAAEAAGMLRGNEGFWEMHEWLFSRGGGFTDAELHEGLRQLGYDPQQFIRVMTSNEPLDLVQADIEEGYALGLFFTPMVFINGVEVRGFINNPTALRRAVDAVAATNPPPGSPTQDRPPLAPGKILGDWREQHTRNLPPKTTDWSLGPADAKINVWVWGDYQSAPTRELDEAIRNAMAGRGDVRYIYRQYPMDQSCNPNMQQTVSPSGCWAARAAEAAGHVGGNEGYWKVHEWLFANPTQLNDEGLRAAAPSLGFDPDALLDAMRSPQVLNAVLQEVGVGRSMIPQGVPTLYVNGKWVARWKVGEINALELIFAEAAN